MDDISLEHLTQQQKTQVRASPGPYEELFSSNLGAINITKHSLELNPGAKPFYSNPYRAGPEKRKIIEDEIEGMLDKGVIEPTISEWAALAVLAPKTGGEWRFCIDYRKLNEMVKREVYPLPRLEDCIDTLGHSKWFSTFDANCGYWQGVSKTPFLIGNYM